MRVAFPMGLGLAALGVTFVCTSSNANGTIASSAALSNGRRPASETGQPVPAAASTALPYQGAHLVRTHDTRFSVLVASPSGCSLSGSLSFTGGGSGNVPGGNAAGVLAGTNNRACDSVSAVGAGSSNVVGGNGGSYDAAIVAGISSAVEVSAGAIIGGGENNVISELPPYYNSNLSAVASGFGNVIASPDSFIGAGQANTIVPPSVKLPTGNSPSAFIGAGYGNSIASDFSVISGGLNNAVTGEYATIVGGSGNTITQNGAIGGLFGAEYTVIAGGLSNSILPLVLNGARYGVIGGGHGNVLSSFNGVIAGGESNTASGDYAVVPGGLYNKAVGAASFAAGNGSQALSNGAFVWSDDASGATALKSTGANQFLVRASGGVAFYSNATLKSGVLLQPGGGSWSSLSDRASKANIVAIDADLVLSKVSALPVTEWSYRTEDAAIRHVGPMAQDFYAAFGVGEDERHIATIDEDGVALVAIKALNAKNATLEAQVRRLAVRDAKLESAVAALLARNK